MDDSEKTTRELEWFDLETRMRELIHSQLEPILTKSRDDRESTQNIKVLCKALDSRIKNIETVVLGDQSHETIIENIYKRCAEIEGNRKKDIVSLEQSINLIHESINSFRIEIEKFHELLKLLEKRDKSRESEIAKVNENIDVHKTHVLTEISQLNENFKEMNRVYQEIAMKTEEQANIATAKATANSLEMGNYKREIDSLRKDVVESLKTIKEVKGLKLNIETFESEQLKIQHRFLQQTEEISKFKQELLQRDSFVDNYVPMQTVIFISDYLYSVLDNSLKKKIADYENYALKDLNAEVLGSRIIATRQEKTEEILQKMKHIEERKVEFQTKEIKTPAKVFNEIREKINNRRGSFLSVVDSESPVEVPVGLSKQEVEKIVQVSLTTQLDAEIGRLKTELKEKINSFKAFLKSLNTETSSMQNHFLTEVENMSSKLKLTKSDISLEIIQIRKECENIRSDLTTSTKSLSSLTQMLVCLFEYCSISQMLEKQDEEDRHNMAITLEKELQNELASYVPKGSESSSLSSGNFSFQKKCLSCGTSNSILSGFRTSIAYNPSSLVYKNKKFERQELLGVKGQMIKKCWENIFPTLNIRHDDLATEKSNEKFLEKSFDRGSDRPSKFSRLSSIDETVSDTKDALPMLVSPSIRSRTNQKNMRFLSKNN